MSLFVLDDIGVVFSEASQEIYELNTTATYIWCRLEEGTGNACIANGLASTFGFSQAAAQSCVDETLEHWAAMGFMDGTVTVGAKAGPVLDVREPEEPPPGHKVVLPRGVAYDARYDILGVQFCIGLATQDLKLWVCPALTHLEVNGGGNHPGEIVIEVGEDGGEHLILENGQVQFHCAALEQVTPCLIGLMFTRVLQQMDYSVAFHAGAVSDGHRALILPGAAGSGKTTLTAALVAAGFDYVSDDLLLMRRGEKGLEGVPFSIGVKEPGVDVLIPLFPELKSLRTHLRGDGKRLRYLPPPRRSLPGRNAKRTLAHWVVFPHYNPGQAAQLSEIRRSEALRRLIGVCTLSRPLSRHQVGSFVGWLQGVSCYDLAVGHLDEAVATVKKLWATDVDDGL